MTGAGTIVLFVIAATCAALIVHAKPSKSTLDDKYMHPLPRSRRDAPVIKLREGEDTAEFWREQAQATIEEKLHIKPNTNIAKNVIMFLGDGMSIPTLMAARVWMNQKDGKINGEENVLSFEKFPYTGLSKTYCIDKQVADSACTATAYLTGIKANEGTIGVTGAVPLGDCTASLPTHTHVDSIAKWSQLKGKKTGLVTTTRVTHASPAGVYSHIAHRDWENNAETASAGATDCKDIAHQLIYEETGANLNVILGGGSENFYLNSDVDPEGNPGYRTDENLVEKWKELKGDHGEYVSDRDGLLNVPDNTEYVLGLFESSHCPYELDRNKQTDPSLTEMVEKAIKLLENMEGFFLFVEGGLIDYAHHDGLAKKALAETVEFSNAIKQAIALTSRSDTLIVVTSDHAHTMSVSGYPSRGNDILGQPVEMASDNIPYSTITYANGPGYKKDVDGVRYDISKADTHNNEFAFPSISPLESETHGGDDVGIFAIGPWAHLLTGTIEQNVIPHVMAYASCVGDGASVCNSYEQSMNFI